MKTPKWLEAPIEIVRPGSKSREVPEEAKQFDFGQSEYSEVIESGGQMMLPEFSTSLVGSPLAEDEKINEIADEQEVSFFLLPLD